MIQRTVVERADWMRFPEIAYDTRASDSDWTRALTEAFESVLARSLHVGFQELEHDESLRACSLRVTTKHPLLVADHAERWHEKLRPFLQTICYPPVSVVTHGELSPRLPPDGVELMHHFHQQLGIKDCLGIVLHPAPNAVVVVWSFHDEPVELTRHERHLLTRLSLHVESGYRLRKRRVRVVAELTEDGRVIDRDERAPSPEVLERHGTDVAESRAPHRRREQDAIELWTALVEGRLTLAPSSSGARRGYVVLDNPPEAYPLRCLSPRERDVLSLAARGFATKMIAYALGTSSAYVSSTLATIAAKLGLATRAEVVRVAAMFARDPRMTASDAELSAAESEVLDLLQRGLSNAEIARLRARSIRTIANQVASILKKTGTGSRRELVARAPLAVTASRACG